MINAVDVETSKSLVNVSPADLKVICLVATASAVVVAAAVVAFVVAVVLGATVVVSVKEKISV